MAANDKLDAHKQAAVEFLQLAEAGRIDEAYQKYVDMDGKHHNPSFPAGFPALQQAMRENHIHFPNKEFEVRHVLAEGDLVAVHSRIVLKPGENGIAALHLFRFQDEKIVELWDFGLPIPDNSPNGDGVL